jgi:hypothetical protein
MPLDKPAAAESNAGMREKTRHMTVNSKNTKEKIPCTTGKWNNKQNRTNAAPAKGANRMTYGLSARLKTSGMAYP